MFLCLLHCMGLRNTPSKVLATWACCFGKRKPRSRKPAKFAQFRGNHRPFHLHIYVYGGNTFFLHYLGRKKPCKIRKQKKLRKWLQKKTVTNCAGNTALLGKTPKPFRANTGEPGTCAQNSLNTCILYIQLYSSH